MNTHVKKASLDFDFNDAWAFIGFAQAGRKGNDLGSRVWPALRQAKDWLVEKLRPISAEEAFLAKSQNHADLERRILILQRSERDQSGW
jgi:hypothetical protein